MKPQFLGYNEVNDSPYDNGDVFYVVKIKYVRSTYANGK